MSVCQVATSSALTWIHQNSLLCAQECSQDTRVSDKLYKKGESRSSNEEEVYSWSDTDLYLLPCSFSCNNKPFVGWNVFTGELWPGGLCKSVSMICYGERVLLTLCLRGLG